MSGDLPVEAGAIGTVHSDVVRAQIVVARAHTRETMENLEAEVRQSISRMTDWRTAYRTRPTWFIAASLFVGFFVGYRRRTPLLEHRP